ncbi:MAG: TolC family protein [Deltaproteobacteria bacterium]|nr:TolC family protein [Deltaproteobacteria bacterium]
MSSLAKLSIGTAVAVTLFINVKGSAQTLAEPPSASAESPSDKEQPQSGFELRELPESQLDSVQALEPKPGGLTADEVAAKAVKSSPTLRARQAEIDAAQAKVDDAVARFLPRLTLKASYQRLSEVSSELGGAIVGSSEPSATIRIGPCSPGSTEQCAVNESGIPIGAQEFEFPSLVNTYALNASLSLPLSDYLLRLSKSIAATQENRRAAELQKEAVLRKIESDARIAYYNWLKTLAGCAVAQASLERFNALLADARTAYDVGSTTKADVLRLEAAVAGTQYAIIETETLRSVAEEQLAVFMGEPVKRYQVGEAVAVDAAGVEATGELKALIADAFRQRLELEALKAGGESLREGSGALAIGRWPRLDAFGDVTYANPNQRIFPQEEEWNATWAVGLSLSWNINDAFSGSAQSAEIDALRAKLEANLEELERGIKLEVTSAYMFLKKARVAVETSSRSSAAAKEAYRVASDLYRVGRATTTDLISAESELVAASIKEINAALDYHVAKIMLAHAVGKKL